MAEFTPVCPSGSVSLSRTLGEVKWLSHRSFLNTEESLDDYAKFYYSVEDIISSLVLSAISENEIYNAGYSVEELSKLQIHYFDSYMRSCELIQYDSNVDQIIRDGVLNCQSFCAPFESAVRRHLSGNRLLGAINEEYSQELADMTKQFEEDCHLTTKLTRQTPTGEKLLLQLNDRAHFAKSWIFENFPKLKGRVGEKYGAPYTRHVLGFVLFAASLATLGTGKQD